MPTRPSWASTLRGGGGGGGGGQSQKRLSNFFSFFFGMKLLGDDINNIIKRI